ncbi:Lrp/AsnC family transcriptional regulator [Inquilinus limosus]|uniref:AsnC family transcriptional regulator n=1 Tax=Inquilinus limosus TaxID=171674 RepID=A0A211ZIZ8_9PROT|nr:Lrp/AsnC family transcriptional regulator [Inquilinus limosus]OWJ65047.1 AsnC family transcriptional regulator [Inquilinus limosus]
MTFQLSPLLADDRNLALIRLLQAEPRLGTAELARRIGMSAPAVRERLLRLEEAGVIRGWRLELEPKALGYPLTVFVRIRPMPGQVPKIAELARAMPQVAECHRITGEDCFILKVHVEAIETLDRLLDRFLAHGQTTTSIVQSTPVPPRDPPLPG